MEPNPMPPAVDPHRGRTSMNGQHTGAGMLRKRRIAATAPPHEPAPVSATPGATDPY
jgi:hypothetical protein